MLEGSELIVFDLDGVLIDSKKTLLYIFRKALENQGYSYSHEQIRPLLAKRDEFILSELIPKEEKQRENKIEEMIKSIDQIILNEGVNKVRMLPYAKETLGELKKRKYRLALLTNSRRAFVEGILKKFSLGGYWVRAIVADNGFESKKEAIKHLIRCFKTTPDKTAYIGDMVNDVETARDVGCKIIAIPGWDSEKMLKRTKPDHLIHNLKELIT